MRCDAKKASTHQSSDRGLMLMLMGLSPIERDGPALRVAAEHDRSHPKKSSRGDDREAWSG